MNYAIIKITKIWKQLKDMSNRAYIDRLLATHLSNIIYLPKM